MEREFNLTARQCEALLDIGSRHPLGFYDQAALADLIDLRMVETLLGNPRPVLTPRGQRAYRELMGIDAKQSQHAVGDGGGSLGHA